MNQCRVPLPEVSSGAPEPTFFHRGDLEYEYSAILMLAKGNAFNVAPPGSSNQNPLLSNATVVSSSCFFPPDCTPSIAFEKTSVNEAGCSGNDGLGSVVRGADGETSFRGAGLGCTGVAVDPAGLRSVPAVTAGGVDGDCGGDTVVVVEASL